MTVWIDSVRHGIEKLWLMSPVSISTRQWRESFRNRRCAVTGLIFVLMPVSPRHVKVCYRQPRWGTYLELAEKV